MYIGNDLQVAESGNKIIDDISSSFNGSTTSFALLVGGAAPVPFPINTQQIYISVNGVIQEPDPTGSAGFKLLGNNIVFSSAPANGHAFFGVILSGADYVTVGTEFPAGSSTAPSITFGNDNNTGLYSVTGGTMGFTSDGAQTFTMDSNGFNFPDGKKVNLGSSSDLAIYHDGSHSYIKDAGTGQLRIQSNAFSVENAAGNENMIFANEDGNVTLYYNNAAKLSTTNTGTNVTGVHVDDGATHDGDVTFTGAAANVVWDKSADDLIFNDNAKAIFGTSSDGVEIFHDGSNSYIKDVGTGNLLIDQSTANVLYLRSDDLRLSSYTGTETYIDCNINGAVELYYDNSKKFETNADGARVTGDLQLQGSAAFWDNSDGSLILTDNYKVKFGTGNDLVIFHNSYDSYIQDAGTGSLVVLSNDFRVRNAAENEDMLRATENGAVELYHDNAKKLYTSTNGAVIESGTANFEIYSSTDDANATLSIIGKTPNGGVGQAGIVRIIGESTATNNGSSSMHLQTRTSGNAVTTALTIDASQNVGIGTSSPSVALDIVRSAVTNSDRNTDDALTIENNGTTNINLISASNNSGFLLFSDDERAKGYMKYDHSAGWLEFKADGTQCVRMQADNLTILDGDLVIGTAWHGIDFSATGQSGGMTSEKLTIFEEGTFTPSFAGTSGTGTFGYGQQLGKYVRIGNSITFSICLQSNSHSGTTSGGVRVAGLPYAVNGTESPSGGACFFITGFNENFDTQVVTQLNSSEEVEFYRQAQSTGSNYQTVDWSNMNNAGLFVKVAGTYISG